MHQGFQDLDFGNFHTSLRLNNSWIISCKGLREGGRWSWKPKFNENKTTPPSPHPIPTSIPIYLFIYSMQSLTSQTMGSSNKRRIINCMPSFFHRRKPWGTVQQANSLICLWAISLSNLHFAPQQERWPAMYDNLHLWNLHYRKLW